MISLLYIAPVAIFIPSIAAQAALLYDLSLNNYSCSWQNASCVLATDPLQSPFPYAFPPQESADTSALFPMQQCHGLTLEEATIDQLQEAMSNGKLTSVQLVQCYLRRVLQVDEYIR